MEWYYSSNEVQQGPVSEDQLKGLISSGVVKPEDLVWKEGMPDWVAWSTIPELGALAGAVPVSAPVVEAAAPVSPTSYQALRAPAVSQSSSMLGTDIPTYLWQSIVATIVCCFPFGIVAIVYASKVDGLKQVGDFERARSASNSAKLWVNISAGGVLLLILLASILGLFGALEPSGF